MEVFAIWRPGSGVLDFALRVQLPPLFYEVDSSGFNSSPGLKPIIVKFPFNNGIINTVYTETFDLKVDMWDVSFNVDGAITTVTDVHGGSTQPFPSVPIKTIVEGLYAGDITNTGNVTFLGWTINGGNTYYNGNTPTITGNTTFTAHWAGNSIDLTSTAGANLVEKAVNYTNGNSGVHTLFLNGSYNNANLTVKGNLILRGANTATIYLTEVGNLFIVDYNGTLTLDDGVTLDGNFPNTFRESQLVSVMGARFNGGWLLPSTFNMTGGTIQNIRGLWSQGVLVNSSPVTFGPVSPIGPTGGIFNMSGGTITNNHDTNDTGSAGGGGVLVTHTELEDYTSGVFVKTGGTISDNVVARGSGSQVLVERPSANIDLPKIDYNYKARNTAAGPTVYLDSRTDANWEGYDFHGTFPANVGATTQLTVINTWQTATTTWDDIWFSFPVTAGTTCYVWLDDKDQSPSFTGDPVLHGYSSDRKALFIAMDTGSHTPRSFTATANSTVFLRATRYIGTSPGTFAVAYSTSNTRP